MSRRENNQKRIYVKHFGQIPKDEHGRSYEVHHKDGNHKNNDPSNLIAISIEEHYNIHYANNDWDAARLIALRMNKSPEEISELSRRSAIKKIEDGTHHFIEFNKRDRSDIRGDLNPMRNPEIAKKVSEKTKGKRKNWTDKKTQADINRRGIKLRISKENIQKKKENGRKQFTLNNPSKIKKTCDHCGKMSGLGNHSRWHGDNCRNKQ
jgi:hypothetical protein